MDDRIVDLETKSAYQEHLLQELNDVIFTQQQQIDGLEAGLRRLKEHVQSTGEQGQSESGADVPPPHY